MRLTLQIRSYCDSPPADPKVRSFDTFPVIVGRSSACDYSLNDASRYISSNHAVVVQENGQLFVQDTSANGVYVNGSAEPVGRGRSVPLSHNDALTVGDYTVIALIEQAPVQGSRVDSNDPFAEFASAASDTPAAPPAFDPFRGDEPDWTPPSAVSDDPFGDDWDINDAPSANAPATPAQEPSPAAPSPQSAGDWADWDSEPAAPASSQTPPVAASDPFQQIDDDFDWLPGNNSETVSIPPSTPEGGARPPRANRPPEPRRSPAPRAAPAVPPAPAARPAPAAHPPSSPARSAPATLALSELMAAAGLRESDFAHQSDAQMLEQTGRLLHQMADAMMVLLQSRAEVKNAMRSDVTQLNRANNNPLKFSLSASDALTKLLLKDTVGYMESETAIQEAVDDLKLHQIAMLEGMKAAVRSMLVQFDPGKLEKTLEKTGGISANIPITREAKLWELFCEQYDAIREEAVSDFSELFGAEFRKAYEARIRKLGRQPDF